MAYFGLGLSFFSGRKKKKKRLHDVVLFIIGKQVVIFKTPSCSKRPLFSSFLSYNSYHKFMADFICLAMASQYTESNPQEQQQQQQQQTSFRRSLGTSTLFGRRSSRSAASTTTPTSTTTRPTSDSSIIADTTTHIRIVPSIENPSRSLVFNIIERDLEAGRIIKIGRFTDRSSIQNHISFKSKVVSRSHCEIWLNNEGKVKYHF
jgi:hypothetical protein